ncbi:MAG: 16S rRNA (adenine(1518)-N(6)/adenine(1519)-N(6))-dimethyltransferase RsmA [Thermodesulfobacteriota bacterium]
MNIKEIKNILHQERLAPLKQLGQNFLIHPATIERLVQMAGISRKDNLVELGVGLGSLTRILAREARHVTGLEIDRKIISWHQNIKILPENVKLLHQDMLKADFKDLASGNGAPLKIIANLPYSIASPLVFKLIKNHQYIEWAVLMFQKEVALRLISSPGTKNYGILSVLLAGCAEVEKLLELGPSEFYPRPKINSQVLKIRFQPVPDRVKALPEYDKKLLARIVKSAFQKRRKTITTALANSSVLAYSKNDIVSALDRAEINQNSRAEKLAIEEYVALTRQLR